MSDSLRFMGSNPPGSSVHVIFQQNTGVDCHLLLGGIFPTQGLNPHLLHLLHWQVDSLPLVPPGKPVCLPCCCLALQLCLTLDDPMDYSLPDSSVHGIPRQEYWSELPCPPPGDLPNLGIKPRSSALQADSLLSERVVLSSLSHLSSLV